MNKKGRVKERNIEKKLDKYERKLQIFFLILFFLLAILYFANKGFASNPTDFLYRQPINIYNYDTKHHYNETIVVGFNPHGHINSNCADIRVFNDSLNEVPSSTNLTFEYAYMNCSSSYVQVAVIVDQVNKSAEANRTYYIYYGSNSTGVADYSSTMYGNPFKFIQYFNRSSETEYRKLNSIGTTQLNNLTYEDGALLKWGFKDNNCSIGNSSTNTKAIGIISKTNCTFMSYQKFFSPMSVTFLIDTYWQYGLSAARIYKTGFYANNSKPDQHLLADMTSINSLQNYNISMYHFDYYESPGNFDFLGGSYNGLTFNQIVSIGLADIHYTNATYTHNINGNNTISIWADDGATKIVGNNSIMNTSFLATNGYLWFTEGYTDQINEPEVVLRMGFMTGNYYARYFGIEANYSLSSEESVIKTLIPCTLSNSTHTIAYNFTLYNETSLNIYSGSFNANFNLTSGVNNFLFVYNSTGTNITLCIPKDNFYYVNAFIQYFGAGFQSRWYFLNNNSINGSNIEQDIPLYSLSTEIGNQIAFRVQDQTGTRVQDAYIFVKRYYPEENLYRLVAMGHTNAQGEDLIFLRMSDVWYQIEIWKDLQLKFTSAQTKIITGTDPLDPLTFTITSAGSFSSYLGRAFKTVGTLYFNNATRTFTGTFTDPTGATSQVCLKVTDLHKSSNQIVCNPCLTSASGTLTCNVGSTLGTYSAQLIGSGSPPSVIIAVLHEDMMEVFRQVGAEGLFAVFFLLLIMTFVAYPNPVISLIFGAGAWIVTFAIGIIPLTAGFGAILALYGIAIWRVSAS